MKTVPGLRLRATTFGLVASCALVLAAVPAASDDTDGAVDLESAEPYGAPPTPDDENDAFEAEAADSHRAPPPLLVAPDEAVADPQLPPGLHWSPPTAENVNLSSPIFYADDGGVPFSTRVEGSAKAPLVPSAGAGGEPLVLLGESVEPGTSARLSWSLDDRLDGIAVATPVLVVNGSGAGPTLCMTAAVHGDELNGVEIVRRILYNLDPAKLSGTVIGVPIVNLPSFRRGTRYLPDRRDLNRYFPGSETGSAASRIAYSFFHKVVTACDALLDIHTGSLHRTNLPQLRADMRDPEVAALTEKFSATAVLHSRGGTGTLRRAAVNAGIPSVTLEAGEPFRLNEEDIVHGTKGVQALLENLGMQKRSSIWGNPEPVYYQSTWVRADRGGLLFGQVQLGQTVTQGQLLGIVSDPITNQQSGLHATRDGRVLGMALNQVVMPGFAVFRIGIETSEAQVAEPEAGTSPERPPEELAPDDEDEHS